jgi:general secretion pathway protein I
MSKGGQRGFALLEVLVAFAIAAMALALLYEAASTGGAATESAGYYEEAVSRAKSHMAALGRDTPVAEGEREGDDGGPFRWRIAITPAATAEPDPAAPPSAERLVLYNVEVGISWTVSGRKREVVLHSQRLSKQTGGANG